MSAFDGSATSIDAVATALDGLSNKSKIAILSMFNLNKAQAEAILINIGLKDEELKTAIATVTAGNAAKGAAGGFGAFAASVKAAATGLATFLLTNPVGWAILAAGAILGTVVAYDALTVSAEEATKKMNESFEEFEAVKQEVSDLNSELETTKDKINALESKGGLSFVEQSELEKLRESVRLLEIQADLAEKKSIKEGKEAAEDTVTSYNKNFVKISKDKTDQYSQGLANGEYTVEDLALTFCLYQMNLFAFNKEYIIPQYMSILASIPSLSSQPYICLFTGANWKTEID